MNGEDMAKALGFIDEKYIDEADTAKLTARGIWLRVGSLAACLCVLMAGIYGMRQASIPAQGQGEPTDGPGGYDGIMESMPESSLSDSAHSPNKRNENDKPEAVASGIEPNAYGVSTQEIRTDGGAEGISYPFVTVLRSTEELEGYCLAQREIFDLESGFLDACSRYNDSYFAQNDLILVCIEEESGSVTHQITDVYEEKGVWIITVVRHMPQEKTDDMAQWHILVEVQMGKVIAPESTVVIRFENKEN